LYESVAEGRRNTTDNLFQLSFDARDTFSRLVNEISEQQQMTVPVEFIQSLEQEIDESILQEYQSIEAEASSEVEESAEVEESVEVEDTSVTTEVADEPEAVDEEAGEQDADTAEEPETEEVEPEQPEPVAKADLELPPLDQTMPFVPVTHQDTFKAAKAQQAKKAARRKTSGEQVKVGSETLEDMVNLASESSILRSRLEQQVNTLQNNLEEMGSTIERLRTQLRAMEVETDAQIQYRQEQAGPDMDEFDPLEMDRYTRQQELARGMSESSNDLVNLKDNFLDLASEAEALLIQQGQINTELQERLIDTRMEPFDSIVPRLQRMVRQISKELKKDINIKITADGEMDRTVLEKMVSPIEHMMRNAIDHGIESPKERSKLGKDKQGKIRIKLAREGAQVVISISDDGRGINIDKVREKAVERGLITEDAELSKTEIFNLIFTAGVSTADEVTQISGRGVGMDVVFSEIKQLGGYVEVESEPNEGSNFMVRLPFTVSVNNALMVMVNEEAFAVPLTNIEGIVTVSPYELEELYKLDEPVYEYAGIEYELNYLGTMLERNKKPDFENILKPLPVMLVHGIEKPVAIQLDGLIGSREVVVKSLGAQLSSISGLSGATILGDGSVVLILDIPSLWRRMNSEQDEDSELEAAAEYDEDYVPTVMVVDDSITVRKVTSRLLERNNFDVMTAKDGVDASTKLQDEQPDIILLDIEMPKMDGFELATIVKSDDELKHIPIIMITSRTGEKHKERAMNIGVEDFMGKPFAEDALLQRIDELIAKKRG
ncbi:MAG: response regulator, partial [Gammaproteobacteria bacterium]